jgi:hypothetical protein
MEGKEVFVPMILNFGTKLSSVLRSCLLYFAAKKTLVGLPPEESNEIFPEAIWTFLKT